MSGTGQWPTIPADERMERMDITARVAAMNATVEAERRAMEARLQKLEETVSKGVARALAWLAGLAFAMVGGIVVINVQLALTEERQEKGEQHQAEVVGELKRRISENERRLDRLEFHETWEREPADERVVPEIRHPRQGGRSR